MRVKLKNRWKKFIQWWPLARILGALLLIIGLAGVIDGPIPYPPFPGLSEFHRKVSPTLVGIGLLVLIIDPANERRAKQFLKKQLIREMSSRDNGIALRAVRELDAYGWMKDGALQGAFLPEAQLKEADLGEADMRWARLSGAELQGAKLEGAKLQGADLFMANLQEARLWGADLRRAMCINLSVRPCDNWFSSILSRTRNRCWGIGAMG